MKKNINLFLLPLVLVWLFTSHIAYADQCIQPTPPICYDTVSKYRNVPEGGQPSDGSILLPDGEVISTNGEVFQSAPTEQVQVTCSYGSSEEIHYEGVKLLYDTCVNYSRSDSTSSKSSVQSTPTDNTTTVQETSCNDNFAPNSIRDKKTNKCVCESGYTITLDSSDKLACMTPQEIQDTPKSPSFKEGILNSQKVYPDAGITGLEKTSQEIRDKILKSGSYLAYKKIKPLTADQIIMNINILGNKPDGSPQDMQKYVDFLSDYQTIPKLATAKHPAYSVSALAKIIKIRYPEYSNTDDTIVVKKFIAMYPVFKDRVNMETLTTSIQKTTTATTDLAFGTPSQRLDSQSIVTSNVPVTKPRFFQQIGKFFSKFKFW